MANLNDVIKRLLYVVLFSPLLICAQLQGDSYSDAIKAKSAKIYYVYDGIDGFATIDADGNMKGMLVDIMRQFERYLLEKKGISIASEYFQVQDMQLDLLFSEVARGQGGVFGLSDLSITEERKKQFQFSPPYLSNVLVTITNLNSPTLTSAEDVKLKFKGMKAYAAAPSAVHDRLVELRSNYWPDLEIVTPPTIDDAILEVLKNDNAFATVDLHYYIESLKNGYPIKRHAVLDKSDDKLGIIMSKSNDWASVLKEFFESGFMDSPEYRKTIIDNIGKEALRLIVDSDQ